MRLIRVFPRRTRATPDDDLAVIGEPRWFDQADKVHISVTFTWDLPEAERLERQWRHVAQTIIGGPATGQSGQGFIAGKYLKRGYVITSRGCPNRCWFCSVPGRDGDIRELPIVEGWNILDDNLLACSRGHIKKVFEMLERQDIARPQFTGGLEAKRLESWHLEAMRDIKTQQFFFAYDTADDWEPLRRAAEMLPKYGFNRQQARCYVLIGYPSDTIERAQRRLGAVLHVGLSPMAMLWRHERSGQPESDEWRQFQRIWARPAIVYKRAAVAEPGLCY